MIALIGVLLVVSAEVLAEASRQALEKKDEFLALPQAAFERSFHRS